MKVAVLAPFKYLDQLSATSTYHEVLAHLYLQSKEYQDYYKRMIARGDRVIVDNSAYELGQGVDGDWMAKIVQSLQPYAMFLPDKRFDCMETVQMSTRAAETIRRHSQCQKVNLWAVPQGSNLEEVIHSYTCFYHAPWCAGFGLYEEIGMVTGLGTRYDFCKYLESKGLVHPNKEYHMLGMEENIHEVKRLATLDWVGGIDSVKPIVYGMNNIDIAQSDVVEYPHRPDMYFELPYMPNMSMVEHNVRLVQIWASKMTGINQPRA